MFYIIWCIFCKNLLKNVETKDIGYRAMNWNSTGNLWVVDLADEIVPKESK